MSEATVTLRLKTNEVKMSMHERIDQATRDTFNLDILPEAVQNSPVTPEGLEYNITKFNSKSHRPGTEFKRKDTGHNRQSLDVEFNNTPSGTEAELFSQSGYGGYLEKGTSKMRAQPYIWPAFMKFWQKIADRVREGE